MSHADRLRNGPTLDDEVEEVDYTVTCSRCFAQPDKVMYNKSRKLLFWECPNGHKDFIEEWLL